MVPNGPRRFDPVGDMRFIPPEFGTQPIPGDSVRVNHYTSDDSVESIRSQGLTMQHAHESYARGGTEYPSIFANAGVPSESLLRSRPVVEAHIPVANLDIGSRTDPRELESRRSTVTTNMDVPPSNIIAIHQPWHQTFRTLQNSPDMESDIVGGMYDNTGDEDADRAIDSTKVALMSKVLLGGRLGRRGDQRPITAAKDNQVPEESMTQRGLHGTALGPQFWAHTGYFED